MAINVPMPELPGTAFLKGIDTGSSMFTRLMQPILQREQQKQLDEHFKKEFGLKQAASSRAAALQPLQRQMLEQQLLGLKHKNDPMYEINQWKALQDMIMGGGQPGGQGGQEMPQSPMPTKEMGEGLGMFSPEGMGQSQQAQQQAPQGGQMGGINLEALRQNPMLRGFFKHKFGVDPLAPMAQTPEDKQAAALDLFKQKEQIKQQNKSGDIPTNTVLTQNQQALQGIKTVLPMLDELIDHPKSVYGPTDFSPSKKAAYNAKTSGMIDTLVAAQSLPKVQASIDLVEQQIRRGTNESTDSYIKRLKDLRKDLVNRKGRAKDVLSNHKVNINDDDEFSQMSDDELRNIAGGG